MSHTEFINQVNTGFGCERHACFEQSVEIAFIEIWTFVGYSTSQNAFT
jgi:hypothetical protein